jgi:cell division protein ZapA
MEDLSVSLTICDRTYRLVIDRPVEELFRKAAKLIDHRVRDYSANYAYKDKQDLLAMVALEYTTRYLQDEQSHQDQKSHWEHKLSEIDKSLDIHLGT